MRTVLATLLAVSVAGLLPAAPASAASVGVTIITPTPSSIVRGPVVPFSASTTGTVQRVEFYAGSTLIGVDTQAPWSVNWNTTTVADGEVTIRARAVAAGGAGAASRSRRVFVDNAGPEIDMTAPSVSVVAPTAAEIVTGSVSVEPSIVEAHMHRAELWIDGVPHSSVFASPWNLSFDSTLLTDGPHVLRVRAVDRAGNVGVAERQVTVANQGFSVTITSPNPDVHRRGLLNVAVGSTGFTRIVETALLVNDVEVASYPYLARNIGYDTATHSGGLVSLQVKATDHRGNVAYSQEVPIVIDNTPPSLSILSPRPNQTVAGTTPVSLSLSDDGVLARIELWVNGSLAASDDEAPFTVSMTAPAGPFTMRLVAWDAAGNRSSASRSVTGAPLVRPFSIGSPEVTLQEGAGALVTWTRPIFAVNRPVVGFNVFKGGQFVTTVPGSQLYWVDSETPEPGTTYEIQSYNTAGVSPRVAVVYTPALPSGFGISAGTANEDEITSLVPTDDGGAVVSGYVGKYASPPSSPAVFGTITRMVGGVQDGFVGKVDEAGDWQWVTMVGGSGLARVTEATAAGNGAVLVTGWFQGTATFGATTFTSEAPATFLARVGADGAWQWVLRSTGDTATPVGIATTADGGAIVAGRYTGQTTFGSTALDAADGDAFVAKVAGNGTWQWVVSAIGAGASPVALAATSDGGAVVTGNFSGSVDFGSTTMSVAGESGTDVFVAKVAGNGTWQWASAGRTSLGSGGAVADVAVTGDGEATITGHFRSSVSFGATTLTSASAEATSMFVARLDGSGAWRWANSADSVGNAGYALSPNFGDSLVVSVRNFASLTLPGLAGALEGPVAASITKDGAWVGANPLGGDALVVDIVPTPAGSVFIIGNFYASPTIAGRPLVNEGAYWDFFVVKLVF